MRSAHQHVKKIRFMMIVVALAFPFIIHAQSERTILSAPTLPAPSHVRSTERSAVHATIRWNAVADAASYIVELSSERGQQLAIVQNITSTTHHFGKKVLKPNHQYLVKVKAVNSDDVGGPFTDFFEFRTRPARVKEVKILEATTTSVTLEWRKPSGTITSYDVGVMRGEEIVRTIIVDAPEENPQRVRATIGNLNPKKAYAFVVRAGLNTSKTNKGKYSERVHLSGDR